MFAAIAPVAIDLSYKRTNPTALHAGPMVLHHRSSPFDSSRSASEAIVHVGRSAIAAIGSWAIASALLWQAAAALGIAPELQRIGELVMADAVAWEPAVGARGADVTVDAKTLDYFEHIAFGGEFSRDRSLQVVRKWTTDIRLAVAGTPTQQDLETLERVVMELNEIVTPLRIRFDGTNPNATMHFIPTDRFRQQEPNYIEGNRGFFFVWWNRDREIDRSRILIATDGISQVERSHLIREELTQSLGLMNDSWDDPNSTFYQGWTRTQNFTDRDRAIIRLLYDHRVRPGMTRSAIRRLFTPQS